MENIFSHFSSVFPKGWNFFWRPKPTLSVILCCKTSSLSTPIQGCHQLNEKFWDWDCVEISGEIIEKLSRHFAENRVVENVELSRNQMLLQSTKEPKFDSDSRSSYVPNEDACLKNRDEKEQKDGKMPPQTTTMFSHENFHKKSNSPKR